MRLRGPVSALFAAVLLLESSASFAAPLRAPLFADDPAAAQALFTDAKRLMSAGKYTDACPKLEESDRASPAIGTKFNLADCYEHVGKTASAWAGFLSVAAAAKNTNQPAREKAARDRAKALEPKLSRIAIVVQEAVGGLEVKRDDEVIGSVQWGEALPVDPGQHTLTAKAPGKRAWKTIVEIAAGPGSVKVIIPALESEPTPPPAPVAAAAPPPSPATPAPAESSSSNALPWVLVGVGAAALIGGGVLWVVRSNDLSSLQAECGPSGNQCPASASGDISNGKTFDIVSVALFAVGGAAVLGGAGVLLFGGHSSASTGATARLLPVGQPGGAGLRLEGSF
jgi:hypothetical protein